MAAPRLPFLWPVLFRRPYRPVALAVVDVAAPRSTHRPAARSQFTSSARRREQPSTSTRYGTANEPPPPSKAKVDGSAPPAISPSNPDPQSASAQEAAGKSPGTKRDVETQPEAPSSKSPLPPVEELALLNPPSNSKAEPAVASTNAKAKSSEGSPSSSTASQASAATTSIPDAPQSATAEAAGNALSTLLQMEPPMASEANPDDKPPHLQAPPYVHHFDTYTLVKNLQGEGGWSEIQAIEVMKAMRGLLTVNMELARDGLVSKGDAEMESYLFRAACSELRTEIKQRRRTAHNQMGSQRGQLQHEVDILGQRIGQETGNLKDELKGMFDDRKMAVRQERRSMENRIQELNYKITIALNSEMRSEVEGLRWVITRRVVIALLAVVVGALAVLRFSKNAEAKSVADRRKHDSSSGTADGGRDDGTQTVPRELDLTSPEVMKRLDAGDSPALVSLG